MTRYNTLDVLCAGDSYQYAKDIWHSIEKRAKEIDGIRAVGEYDSSNSWQQFCWKELSQAEIQPFEDGRDADQKPVPDVPHVEIRYDTEPFRDAIESHDESRLAKTAVDLLELVEYAHAGGPDLPRFVYGVSEPHRARLVDDEIRPPATVESLEENRIEYASWLMGFPPDMVDTYGRETLLSAPAWQTSELPDGGVAILTTEEPSSLSKPETRAIDQHLDLDPPPETEDCEY